MSAWELVWGACFLGLGAAWFSPQGFRLLAVRRLERRCRETRSLVLTYDDGPGPILTPALLDLLAAHEARATFLPLGRRAVEHPEVLDRVAAAGHEIGCHAAFHRNAWKVSPAAGLEDVEVGYSQLARWVPPHGLFRPPHGKLTLATWWALRRRHAPVAWWTFDSGDTFRVLPRVDDVVGAVRRAGGGIVLMHDFDRAPERQTFVLSATERLLKMAREEGLLVQSFGALAIGRSASPAARTETSETSRRLAGRRPRARGTSARNSPSDQNTIPR